MARLVEAISLLPLAVIVAYVLATPLVGAWVLIGKLRHRDDD